MVFAAFSDGVVPISFTFGIKRVLLYSTLKILLILNSLSMAEAIPPLPVKCNTLSNAQSQNEYLLHEANTTEHRFHTTMSFKLDLNRVSCFQVVLKKQPTDNVDKNDSATSSMEQVKSMFYSFSYHGYQEGYPVRVGDSYTFAIPELRSKCQCYCPTSEKAGYCTSNFDGKYCTEGDICIQKWHGSIAPRGCQSTEGQANMCCSISVRPYKDREFAAIRLGPPSVTAFLNVHVHVLIDDEWVEFKKYSERIDPTQTGKLVLNGDNQLHLDIETFGSRSDVMHHIGIGSKWFYYEHNVPFALRSDIIRHPAGRYHYLVKKRGRWVLENQFSPAARHMPILTNCHEQVYTDRFELQSVPHVVRNSSGALADRGLQFADDLKSQYKKDIKDIRLKDTGEEKTVIFTFQRVPNVNVDVRVQQRVNIISHVHASFFQAFVAKIHLDKHKQRYLNVTIVNGFGRFLINIYRDSKLSSKDLNLNAFASLPLATNHTYLLPLPSMIEQKKYVCVSPDEKAALAQCKWAQFEKSPVDWYEVAHVFIPTEGNCPGCNVYKKQGFASFVDYFNPKNWFKGVNSFSEGVSLAIQVGLYVILALVLFALWRRLIWPLLRWAICSGGGSAEMYYPKQQSKKKILEDVSTIASV